MPWTIDTFIYTYIWAFVYNVNALLDQNRLVLRLLNTFDTIDFSLDAELDIQGWIRLLVDIICYELDILGEGLFICDAYVLTAMSGNISEMRFPFLLLNQELQRCGKYFNCWIIRNAYVFFFYRSKYRSKYLRWLNNINVEDCSSNWYAIFFSVAVLTLSTKK